jgi:hypothetical protein
VKPADDAENELFGMISAFNTPREDLITNDPTQVALVRSEKGSQCGLHKPTNDTGVPLVKFRVVTIRAPQALTTQRDELLGISNERNPFESTMATVDKLRAVLVSGKATLREIRR